MSITEKQMRAALKAALGGLGEEMANLREQTLDRVAQLEDMLKAPGNSEARAAWGMTHVPSVRETMPDGTVREMPLTTTEVPRFNMRAGQSPAEALDALKRMTRGATRYGWGKGRANISGGDARGIMACRAMRAIALARAENRPEEHAIEVANSVWGDPMLAGYLEEMRDAKRNLHGSDSTRRMEAARVLGTEEIGSGASAISVELAAEFLDFLHAKSVVKKLGALTMPLRTGAMDQPFFNTAASVGHAGENAARNESTPQDGNIRFDRKLVRGVAVYSNQWLREASYAMDAILRNHLAQRAALVQDLGVLRGDGAEGAPLGVSYYADLAGNSSERTAASPPATLDEILSDLATMASAVEGGNVPMASMGWATSVRTKWALWKQRDAGNGLIFGEEIRGGTLIGWGIEATTQIPTNLDASGDATNDESELYLADWSTVAVPESEGLETTSLDGAAYNDANGTVQSGFSRDQTAIRVTLGYDSACLYRGAEAYRLDGVDWGA